jgi:hypothetical protein
MQSKNVSEGNGVIHITRQEKKGYYFFFLVSIPPNVSVIPHFSFSTIQKTGCRRMRQT